MKKVKRSLYSNFNILLSALLTILGFSCTSDPRSEYGTPSAKFIVKGKVISAETNKPIPDIQVNMIGDPTYTNEAGEYKITDPSGFPTDQTYPITFTDVDGELNGVYEPTDTIAEFIDPEFSGGEGNWYAGEVSKELNIKLTPKK